MMDCRKPSGGFIDNVKKELMVDGHHLVQHSSDVTRIAVGLRAQHRTPSQFQTLEEINPLQTTLFRTGYPEVRIQA
jgi:hypothetical protein